MAALNEEGAIERIEIIRLNIERYRRLLKANLDENTRCAIERMLHEFNAKLTRHVAFASERGRKSEYDDRGQSASDDE
jgi:hypothetical protein